MQLKPSEIRFWQEVVRDSFAHTRTMSMYECVTAADRAVEFLRERLDDPGPRPDEGRL